MMVSITYPRVLALTIFVSLQVPLFLRLGQDIRDATILDEDTLVLTVPTDATTGEEPPVQEQQAPSSSSSMSMTFAPHLRALYQYRPALPKSTEQQSSLAHECGDDAPHYSAFFRQRSKRRSYLDEDKIVYELFFQDMTLEEMQGFKFVEMGGYDGMDASNSRLYEACLQWEGLLIEPNPKPYRRLVRNRPHAHVASYAASCSEEEAHRNATVSFHDYPFPNAGQADTVNAYSGRHEIQVPCGPLTPVIRDVLGSRVHFMSLDVEGAEPQVLINLDFESIRIDVLIVEVVNPFCPLTDDCASRKRTREILHQNGYRRFEQMIHNSDLFVHNHSPFLIKLDGKAVAVE